MTSNRQLLTALIAILAAVAIAFVLTPLVKYLAERLGFVDIPKDERRMHHRPIPTIGGLAIYAAFLLVTLVMTPMTRQLAGILSGASILVALGVIDDKFDLDARLKFVVQIVAAILPVSQGVTISYISNPLPVGFQYISLGFWAIPITIIWIVAITNAVNFIDGLDGLSVGVCSISCLSMAVIALSLGQSSEAVLLSTLLGACLGFLPYNFNPAKIFMGDTGSTFLGFMLACMSVSGLFKLYTVMSFAVPILVLGVPIFDITFAFLRRIWHHVSPMHPDRSHIHHRLIDKGFNQRQSVAILYVVASLLGVCAVMLSTSGPGKAAMVLLAVIVIGCIALTLLSHKTPIEIMEERQATEEACNHPPEQDPTNPGDDSPES